MLYILLLSLAIHHITKFITESYLLEGIREWIIARSGVIGYGITCFFCTSTWIAIILSITLDINATDLLVVAMSSCALSNLIERVINTLESLKGV
jgi:hypothetical protein